MSDRVLQNRSGIAPSIAEERRFFELYGTKKTDTPKGWNDPKTWKELDGIPNGKIAGYVLKPSEVGIDFDHVFKNGKLIPEAEKAYRRLTKYGKSYVERSLNNGLHMVVDLADLSDNFPTISNGVEQVIPLTMTSAEYIRLSEPERKTVPKIEIFHNTAGRWFYLTGNNTEVIEVAKNEDAAVIVRELLKMLAECHGSDKQSKNIDDTALVSGQIFDVDDDTKAKIIEALKVISPDLGYEDWIRIGQALKNMGFDFSVWDEWSRASSKYNESEMPKKWKSFKGKGKYNAGTIFYIAKQYGWNNDTHNNSETKEIANVHPVFDLTDEGKIYQTYHNAVQAVSMDPELYERLFYDEIAYCPFVIADIPWDHSKVIREWSNFDDMNLLSYIERKYGIKSKDKILSAFDIVVGSHRINPIKQMLEKAHKKWDGKQDHISGLLPNMLGAETNDYNTAVMRVFMLGAICRIYNPGCKYDYVLILVGEQGIGKTYFLRMCSIRDDLWFTDSLSVLDSEKAPEKLRGKWIIELAELQSFKRTKDIESIKAFITAQHDDYRPPYGKRTERRPRMCVFAGTTNSENFLADTTGNRRYLPVKCGVNEPTFDMFANEEVTRSEFIQAWGEAMDQFYAYMGKPELVLPAKLQDQAKLMQELYTEEDADVGIIQEWLDNFNSDYVCGRQIWDIGLKRDYSPTRAEQNRLADIMRHRITGWKPLDQKMKFDDPYGYQRGYERIAKISDSIDTSIPFS